MEETFMEGLLRPWKVEIFSHGNLYGNKPEERNIAGDRASTITICTMNT